MTHLLAVLKQQVLWEALKFGLKSGETLTVDEMLKAICVVSANDYRVQK